MNTHICLIDNYDSFTYNLHQLATALGARVTVIRNDQFQPEELSDFDKLLLSPGPGVPAEAGRLLDTIRLWAGRKPILGVCLGEQAIGEVFGARLRNLEEVFHGVQSPVRIVHPDDYLFRGLPQEIHAGRYHSWVVDSDGLPDCLEVTAVSREGYIMALRHKDYDVRGIQFHPESVLTPDGQRIIANWLSAETSTNVQPLNENQQ